jgi:hypothetical protein
MKEGRKRKRIKKKSFMEREEYEGRKKGGFVG